MLQRQNEVSQEDHQEKFMLLQKQLEAQSINIMEMRDIIKKNEKNNMDLSSMVNAVRDAVTKGEVSLEFHKEISVLRKILAAKESEDSLFKDQEKKKDVVLFGEVSELGEKVRMSEVQFTKLGNFMCIDAISRIQSIFSDLVGIYVFCCIHAE